MRRLVLTGASNLTAGLGIVARLATADWGPGPYRVLAAAGHGRAYARSSLMLARSLPAIADCDLWTELERGGQLPTRALIADAGNDLAYGAAVADTVAAVGRCLERLRRAASSAETIVLLPPLDTVARLSPARFLLLRTLLFPGRRFERESILARLRRLDAELRRLAAAHEARAVELAPRWIGGDGIHIRRRLRRSAWSSLLAPWRGEGSAAEGLAGRLRWRFLAADRARLLGLPLHREQPARRLGNGSTISFY